MGWKKKSIALISVVLTTGIVLEIGKSYIMYSLDFDQKIYNALKYGWPTVEVEENIAKEAVKPIEKMLSLS